MGFKKKSDTNGKYQEYDNQGHLDPRQFIQGGK